MGLTYTEIKKGIWMIFHVLYELVEFYHNKNVPLLFLLFEA